jgi:hypothetical protein
MQFEQQQVRKTTTTTTNQKLNPHHADGLVNPKERLK